MTPRQSLVQPTVTLSPSGFVRRAIEIEMPQIGRLRVIYPIDVLDSSGEDNRPALIPMSF